MQLPPLQVTRAVIQRYARLHHRYGRDFARRPFVLPNAEYFPDEFVGDPDSAALLAARMQEHCGLLDIPIECRVVAPGDTMGEAKSCGSGACGVPQTAGSGIARLVDTGESWVLQVPSPELRHPIALTTNIARSLSYIYLVETKRDDETIEPPVDVTADLVAVGLGFGAIMLQGSYIYAKSCGGPQIASVTKVSTIELAIATALFAELGGHNLKGALKLLDATQRAALSEAGRLIRANKKLLGRILVEPDFFARGTFELAPPGDMIGAFMRKLVKKSRDADQFSQIDPNLALEEIESLLIDMPPSSQAGRTRPQTGSRIRTDDLENIVADALKETRAQA
jgi:hypothetical protein